MESVTPKDNHQLVLGIASIGDLLFRNRLSESNSHENEQIKLAIPDYQRPYKWTAGNVMTLLDDIEEAKANQKAVYRVGTLILEKCINQDNKFDFNIVDGQQRIITFFLILKVFIDEYRDQLLGDDFYEYFDNFYKNLKQIQFPNNDLYKNNIRQNFLVIERFVKTHNQDYSVFFKYICNRCEMIVVITSNTSDAFRLFDSQNSRGKKLYPHDLLKAYHLREMKIKNDDEELKETVQTVETWENCPQDDLAEMFGEYLYRLKEWMNGNKASQLTEKNLYLFKGVSVSDCYPYAQFYRRTYYNKTGMEKENKNNSHYFQLNAPVIAGKPFFEYTRHYFDLLNKINDDTSDKDKDKNKENEVNFIDEKIANVIKGKHLKKGTGNLITRLMFRAAVLLYVDRFCNAGNLDMMDDRDKEWLNRFVLLSFIWAYSLRAQYKHVGWREAQNYIMGTPSAQGTVNSFNIFKIISDALSPKLLLHRMSELLVPLPLNTFDGNKIPEGIKDVNNKMHYLSLFQDNGYLSDK